MKYTIVIAKSAAKQYEKLEPEMRVSAKHAMIKYLTNVPSRPIKTRIKRLVGIRKPQYRMRIGDLRIFYDVNKKAKRVEILGFVPKSLAERWLKKKGVQK